MALTFTIRRPAPPPVTTASSEPPPLTSLASPEPAPAPPPVEPTASAPPRHRRKPRPPPRPTQPTGTSGSRREPYLVAPASPTAQSPTSSIATGSAFRAPSACESLERSDQAHAREPERDARRRRVVRSEDEHDSAEIPAASPLPGEVTDDELPGGADALTLGATGADAVRVVGLRRVRAGNPQEAPDRDPRDGDPAEHVGPDRDTGRRRGGLADRNRGNRETQLDSPRLFADAHDDPLPERAPPELASMRCPPGSIAWPRPSVALATSAPSMRMTALGTSPPFASNTANDASAARCSTSANHVLQSLLTNAGHAGSAQWRRSARASVDVSPSPQALGALVGRRAHALLVGARVGGEERERGSGDGEDRREAHYRAALAFKRKN